MNPSDENWFSMVEAPLVLDDEAAIEWDVAAELLVIGWGAAGAACALEAAEAGLEVVALDCAEGGGASALSGGVVYAGGGTCIQERVGEKDTPQAMFDYLKHETQGIVSDETLRRFCEESAGNIDWLKSHGVGFSGPVWKQKTSYPKVEYFLYHSDNSLLPHYRGDAPPAARGHRAVIRKGRSAVDLGVGLMDPMTASAIRLGVQLHKKTEVRQLVLDTEGRVIGLKALQLIADSEAYRRHSKFLSRAATLARIYPRFLPGGKIARKLVIRNAKRAAAIENSERVTKYYRARRGVAICAGGFVFNRNMVDHYCRAFRPGLPLGTPADNGSGIRLGQSVGGATAHMANASAWRFINPPLAWSQGIIVNRKGERFVNESCYGATIGDAMVNKQGGRAWLILDSRLVKQAWWQSRPGHVLPFQWQLAAMNMLFAKKKFKTLDSLCAAFGFDKAVLEVTLAKYNRVSAGDAEDEFGKAETDIHGLRAPFHVIDVSLGARMLPCTVITLGGLVPDEATGQVLSESGEPIPGLYVAGRTAVGVPSKLYVSGLSLADCIFSGRRAARHVASR